MSSKSDVKNFFRQTKKSGGISKSSIAAKKPKHAAAIGSPAAQPPALVSPGGSPDLKDEFDSNEEVLRQFDMNTTYGPCIGLSRMARWERARKLGMNPPGDVERLLKAGKVGGDSLWDGRV